MLSTARAYLINKLMNKLVDYEQHSEEFAGNFNRLIKYSLKHKSRVTSIIEKSVLFSLSNITKGNIIEIGTYIGLSTIILANGIQSKGRCVHTVDTFMRQKGDKKSKERHLFSNISQFKYTTNVFNETSCNDKIKLYNMTSTEFFKEYHIENVDLIFLDGDHTFEGVLSDLAGVQKILNTGGYLVMHDYLSPIWKGVKQATDLFITQNHDYKILFVLGSMAVLIKN